MTFKEIHKLAMPEEKRNEERKNIVAYYFLRPMSYLFTKLLLNTRISPNTVSFWSLLVAVLGFVIMIVGDLKWERLIGLLFFVLWNILDCVDGNIARIKKQFSSIGKLWDAAAGYAAMALMYFAMGICAFEPTNFQTVLYVILGGLSALFCLYPRLLMHFKYSPDSTNDLNDKKGYGLLKNIVFNITSPDCLVQVFMLVAIVSNLEWLFTIVYFILYGGIAIYSSYNLLSQEQ